ncbi:hypothetical protein EJB05_55752, partial [Eragrostis curvula]
MAAFSSRGPNAISPQILKPDITAPGVGIIAAFSGAVSPSWQPSPFDDRRVPYNVMSGTSILTLPLFDAVGNPCTCSSGSSFRPENLNYPSVTVPCLSGGSTTVTRRVKNVGKTASSYSVTAIEHPAGVKVTVQPDKLYLGVEETKEFEVKLEVVNAAAAANYVFGSFEWSDGLHRVRSPVVVKTTC